MLLNYYFIGLVLGQDFMHDCNKRSCASALKLGKESKTLHIYVQQTLRKMTDIDQILATVETGHRYLRRVPFVIVRDDDGGISVWASKYFAFALANLCSANLYTTTIL